MENLNERKRAILDMLVENSPVSVNDISRSLKVSTVTVRLDLQSLEDNGLIARVRGGALPVFHQSILERQRVRVVEKEAIAKSAAACVSPGDTILVEAGTTTALIVKYLLGKRDVHVVTNNCLALRYARVNPSLHLILTGGNFRPVTESCVGSIALRELEQFHVTYAFIGTDGFSVENGLTTHLVEGAEIVRMMASRAEKSVLVADSGKYGKTGFVSVLPLQEVDMIITDDGLAADERQKIERTGVEVRVV
jgi:DeoR family galactitol utilization operon repressor